ncbi:MAG: 4-(cytidine 5'-diphospho)-2-C-methyl-D-erythritol kinase [candidate division WOR-3 bacterium]|nr:4-(cytidine 5'-diphospho)-2-C-methyl-D-erythritol kinase [candidate division WOR-3 bacterium]MCR4422971.1 4-(cytidine 5'-diphospho)-2-C-methyl-D-erythritol kinase [candidate division WOR-3 bacterium]MDH7518310.1 4-(cytidine 5'-diphospho)-2-C-methyl-D-erythritol kinase [bacterium]
MDKITLLAPAKLNLGLWVGKKRRDGFHEILTTMVPLEFGDTVQITKTGSGLKLKITGIQLNIAPEQNLAFRAASLFFSQLKIPPCCFISIHKRIPPGSGLGGGSSDAASVLLGLSALFDSPLSTSKLHRLAAQLGSDVPFFLRAAACVARGRGELLRRVRLPTLNFVLLIPGFGVNTAWAYRALDRQRRKLTAVPISPKILALKLRRNEPAGIAAQLYNSFEPVVFRRFPQLKRAKDLLLKKGACAASLSGSGSTVYGLFLGPDPMAVLKLVKREALGFSVISTRSRPTVRDNWGVV